MTASIDFLIGFTCFGLLAIVYLLYEFIGLFRELVEVLREGSENE